MEDAARFLGRGWAFPPRFSRGGGHVEMVAGIADIHESLQILLATRPGERAMEETYGCNLQDLLFEPVDQRFVSRLYSLVRNAVLYHEPRIRLVDLDVVRSDPPDRVDIRLSYEVPSTNSRFNMVFPFYLQEAAPQG